MSETEGIKVFLFCAGIVSIGAFLSILASENIERRKKQLTKRSMNSVEYVEGSVDSDEDRKGLVDFDEGRKGPVDSDKYVEGPIIKHPEGPVDSDEGIEDSFKSVEEQKPFLPADEEMKDNDAELIKMAGDENRLYIISAVPHDDDDIIQVVDLNGNDYWFCKPSLVDGEIRHVVSPPNPRTLSFPDEFQHAIRTFSTKQKNVLTKFDSDTYVNNWFPLEELRKHYKVPITLRHDDNTPVIENGKIKRGSIPNPFFNYLCERNPNQWLSYSPTGDGFCFFNALEAALGVEFDVRNPFFQTPQFHRLKQKYQTIESYQFETQLHLSELLDETKRQIKSIVKGYEGLVFSQGKLTFIINFILENDMPTETAIQFVFYYIPGKQDNESYIREWSQNTLKLISNLTNENFAAKMEEFLRSDPKHYAKIYNTNFISKIVHANFAHDGDPFLNHNNRIISKQQIDKIRPVSFQHNNDLNTPYIELSDDGQDIDERNFRDRNGNFKYLWIDGDTKIIPDFLNELESILLSSAILEYQIFLNVDRYLSNRIQYISISYNSETESISSYKLRFQEPYDENKIYLLMYTNNAHFQALYHPDQRIMFDACVDLLKKYEPVDS